MDTTTVLIAVGGSLLFFGVLIWKGIWFLRKISEAPAENPMDDPGGAVQDGGGEDSNNG